MARNRRYRPLLSAMVLGLSVLVAPGARGAAIQRSVVGSGWGWDAVIKPGFSYHILGTVGQPGAQGPTGGAGGLYIASGFWSAPSTPIVVDAGDIPSPARSVNALHQNIPNPFNPSTTISFSLAERARVELSVLDVRGRVVEVLLREERDAGLHSFEYRPTDLPSGVYFYRLRAGNFVQTRRLVLLK